MKSPATPRSRPARLVPSIFLLTTLGFGFASCTGDDGDTGPAGPPGSPGTETDLSQGDDPPGLNATVLALTGGGATGGRFRAGIDTPTVQFRVKKKDGSDWDLAEFFTGRALVSGPSFNYQRVIAEQNDVLTRSVAQGDGSYTYTFASPLPATYLPPLNDTPALGADDGELTGQALLDGTYTLALTFSWNFTIDGEDERESENVLFDFVVGDSGSVEHREVVKIENCNRCHEELRFHGGRREEVTLCILCHTSGAEDGETAGVAIDFKVMIHKIHSGEHLPSVQGLTTDVDGKRIYGTSVHYVVGGHDYSSVAFPAWPHAQVATPRDLNYSLLSTTDKAKEDMVRTGPSNCVVCHGDPDGGDDGPAQGDLILAQPKRQACGSCHDDIDWSRKYVANTGGMPEDRDNASCKICHLPSGDSLAVFDAHLHPLKDPSFNTGVNLDVTSLVEAGTAVVDGTIDQGEKIAITFSVVDDAGADLSPTDPQLSIANPSVVISGPTSNYNVLLNTSIPVAALTSAQPFTVNVPMPVLLERLGPAVASVPLPSDFAPHWNMTGATTTVYERTDPVGGGNSTLSAASVAPQNFVDVTSAANFARDEYVVVGDGTASEEYARIQLVEGTRLWFGSLNGTTYKAGLALAHAAATTVREVTLTSRAAGTDYTLNAPAGTITPQPAGAITPGNVLVTSYTTDFVLPTTYPLPLNGSPDLGEANGEWAGKSLVDGTYSLSIWTSRTLTLDLHGESNSYRSTSDARQVDFLVGSATAVEPYDLIASSSACFNCHQELAFHGFGRRGFESCVVCHSAAGGEDRPQYVAGNAPDTAGTTISFRTMLHKIHMGKELANASSYQIVGFGSGSYPNNFGVSDFSEVLFPALPGGVARCNKCHGNDAWHAPEVRDHPTEQGAPIKRWAAVCNACHDSTDATAHISVQTDSAGNESCGVCHGESGEWSVERMHKPY